MKQIVLRKRAVKEPSFKWSHLEIWPQTQKLEPQDCIIHSE